MVHLWRLLSALKSCQHDNKKDYNDHNISLTFSESWECEVNDADMDALCVNEDGGVVQGHGHRGVTCGLHQYVAHVQVTMLKAQDFLSHSQRTRHLLHQADGLGCIFQLRKYKHRT